MSHLLSGMLLGKSIKELAYSQRMLSLFAGSFVGYYPMWEASGLVATDISGNNRHGVYNGVILGQPGIGDGKTCPYFDGNADYNSLPAAFRAAFNPLEGSAMVWFKDPSLAAGVKSLMQFSVDANNIIYAYVEATNQISCRYRAGAVTDVVTIFPATNVWSHLALTWSVAADQFKAYLNGSLIGTATTLGTWAGTIVEAYFGYASTNCFTGNLGRGIILNRAATPAEVLKAATV